MEQKTGLKALVTTIVTVGCFLTPWNGAAEEASNIIECPNKGHPVAMAIPSENPRMAAGQVTGIIKAPIEIVWDVLNDYNSYSKYLPRVSRSKVLAISVSPDRWLDLAADWTRDEVELMQSVEVPPDVCRFLFFNVIAIPFPVRDRWTVLDMVREPEAFSIEFALVAGNMTSCKGSWKLSSSSGYPNCTVVVYTLYSDSGFIIPAIIERAALKVVLPRAIDALADRVYSQMACSSSSSVPLNDIGED
jgi:hypothetical protein